MTLPDGPGRRYILVAEDDGALRDVVAVALRSVEREVLTVNNGCALLGMLVRKQAAKHLPQLVVSDIFMPEMTGLDALCAARRHGIDVGFVFMTAVGNHEVIEQAKAMGALAVFEKPFDVDELCALVRGVACPSF